MSPRYYIISALLVFGVTAGISLWKQKRTKREIAIVLGQVILSFAVILGTVTGVATLMEVLGIAQSGFVF
jgi:heme/copper-type cytochrome/quinol oxidase subunit 1